MKTTQRYAPEVRERAVRMGLEQQGKHPSLKSIAEKFGGTGETLRKWVRRYERDPGRLPARVQRDQTLAIEIQRV